LVEREPTCGDHPRNFRLSPDGKFTIVANMNTGNLVFFRINADTGELTPSGTVLEVPRPMCIRFLQK
jgi:6-phosphogluconolactonase